jgi:hypothetical protein
VHVSPPPAPVVSPPPAPVYVAPPPPPAPQVTTHKLAAKKAKQHRKAHLLPKAPPPVPVSRGAGGPAPAADALPVIPVALHVIRAGPPPQPTARSVSRLLLLTAIALGLLLVLAASLPSPALRPAVVYDVIALHRMDIAAVGIGIVFLVGTIYLLAG